MSAGRRPRARVLAGAFVTVLLVAVAALALTRAERPEPPSERPVLLLVTTLPLIFGEEFSLEGGGSSALEALDAHYRVVPIGTTDAPSLREAELLLMAQPLAQPAEALVDLDRWVREGGRLLLLADPKLDWPSERPLGDKLRPPPAFADTGLLAHWGLRLEGPNPSGPAERELGGHRILAVSPGSLKGACTIAGDAFVARCRIGKGQATIVADADFLNVDQLDGPKDRNLDGLVTELETLGAH